MAVIQLTSQNFRVVGNNRKTLNLNIQEPTLVFFKMQGCQGCQAFEPIFHQLAAQVQGVRYAFIDMSQHRNVVKMSQSTATPIKTVPLILFYTGGNPYAKYNGKKQLPSLKSFIQKVLDSAPPPRQQSFVSGRQQSNYGGRRMEPETKVYMPQMDKAPNLHGIVKGDGTGQYAYLNNLEDEDPDKMETPEEVIPHNVPWESSYKKMGTLD